MPRFFIDKPVYDSFELFGENFQHISKSLRMSVGDVLTLCHDKTDYVCKIVAFNKNSVQVSLLEPKPCDSEPDISVTLFQALPKGDKMDLIIQKNVEIGVCKIVPVLTNRCISRPDAASLSKKISRWQKIALEAAMQSGRGIVPTVNPLVNLRAAVQMAQSCDKTIVFYENAPKSSYIPHLPNNINSIALFIGPEGGFEPDEIKLFSETDTSVCSLGKRILRTETAAIVAPALILFNSCCS